MTDFAYSSVEDQMSRIELQPPKLVQFLQKRDSEFLPNIMRISEM